MGTEGREVLTLQLGHYANHVGTHIWNAQVQTILLSLFLSMKTMNAFLSMVW